ncbi:LCP family protein [Nocardia aurantia]|uniref:Transcriptional regulator LytR n=1 Tax=Nocardia aurantia TaxID=2585199 RepID=A0A7K0DFW4_9NOCA|nr:LCP family protein [Nocardia aurantia]MQY24703.1 Transcriptional regulator LytR [Nocardia aurantia]
MTGDGEDGTEDPPAFEPRAPWERLRAARPSAAVVAEFPTIRIGRPNYARPQDSPTGTPDATEVRDSRIGTDIAESHDSGITASHADAAPDIRISASDADEDRDVRVSATDAHENRDNRISPPDADEAPDVRIGEPDAEAPQAISIPDDGQPDGYDPAVATDAAAGPAWWAVRIAVAACAIGLLTASGLGWKFLRATDDGFNRVAALDVNSTDIVDPLGQLGDENYLIVGTDSRAGVNGQIGAGTTDDADGARSDTVMLVNIPASRQRAVVVSFPRDLDVSRPACEAWNNEKAVYTGLTYYAAAGEKLNGVYALGGPKCLTKVIQKLSGLKINHFVGMDFNGFQAMVDTLGGVEVCASRPIVDGQLGTILASAGRQVLDGSTALDYVRARHVYGEQRSDYDRISRQQRFLSSLLRSAVSNRVLFDPARLRGLVDAFTGHAFMDSVSTGDLLTLGRSLQRLETGSVTFVTLPTGGTTLSGNEIPRDYDIKALFRAIIDDQALPGEVKSPAVGVPTAPMRYAAVDPATVQVQVSNASGVPGLAAGTAPKLAAQGFQVAGVGNLADGAPGTRVRYSSGHEAEAATVASALPGATLEAVPGLGTLIEVALGADFTGGVQAPSPAGSTIPEQPETVVWSAPVTLPADLEHRNAADDICK